ncbi:MULTISPECIES: MAPEG family protein [Pseudomonas]|uniref:Microsomal glutathione S-transferase 1 n=1 Tax=Pseudomonas azadiae TaxID=2843612 RepID=A0ABS6P5M9_9PSED|nr:MULTISPECIES: MAPEG family protein [Pseudomonas]MBV4455790.1 MAPEG family protein [Pseudomonas azadiae]NMF39500.1 MAPEG family protein [Pseudomonas sp. SWRI 103]
MSELLQVYTLCVLVLCLKMFAISCYQGFFRLRSHVFTNPEDAACFNRAAHTGELLQVVRASKAWANDLENIPLFFVIGGLCVVLVTSSEMTAGLFVGFTLARMAHTLLYLGGWQPWRTLAYAVGTVCLFGLGGLVACAMI